MAGVREEIPCKMVKYFRLSGQLKSAVQSGNRPLGCRRLLGWGCWQPPAPSARRRKEASLRVLPSPVNPQLSSRDSWPCRGRGASVLPKDIAVAGKCTKKKLLNYCSSEQILHKPALSLLIPCCPSSRGRNHLLCPKTASPAAHRVLPAAVLPTEP